MSKRFHYQYGGQSEHSAAYQQAAEYDRKNQEAAAQKKEAGIMNIYSHAPSKLGPPPSWEQIQRQKDIEKASREAEERWVQKQQAHDQLLKQQEQDLRVGRIEGISVQSLYEQGRVAENPKVKVKFFWQAFVCGHKEAAYSLYEAFHTGLGGTIRKNEVAAVTFASVGKKLGEVRCMEICKKSVFTLQEADTATYCRAAGRKYNGKVTEDIIKSQLEKFDQTGAGKFPPYNNIDELINAPVEAAGQDGDNHHCILM